VTGGAFTCQDCGRDFDVRQDILDRYPGWTPRQCLDCKNRASAGERPAPSPARATSISASKSRDLTTEEVLSSFSAGPQTGVFTDGASEGNPGPGGWGAVYVRDGEIVEEAMGSEPHTTNNRMELTAIISGLRMLPPDSIVPVYTDSELVVNILTKWAEGWKQKGWKKSSPGPIANLELVKEAYALTRQRPDVAIRWVKAHAGNRWNEYADSLATAYRRSKL